MSKLLIMGQFDNSIKLLFQNFLKTDRLKTSSPLFLIRNCCLISDNNRFNKWKWNL